MNGKLDSFISGRNTIKLKQIISINYFFLLEIVKIFMLFPSLKKGQLKLEERVKNLCVEITSVALVSQSIIALCVAVWRQ